MSWRTVVITKRAKLDFKHHHLVVRGEDEVRIHLSEVACLIIEETAVSMTSYLLAELIQAKIKVIFCDSKRNPISELMPYRGSHDTSAKVREQFKWLDKYKELVWTEIIAQKIMMQSKVLAEFNLESHELLCEYAHNIEIGDINNREGHAAKVYFNRLFGMSFKRSDDNALNAALNYGYTVLLSSINKEIAALGYITQVGIWHDNQFNPFNLGSDLMEPYRPLIDRLVYLEKPYELSQNIKMQLVDILNQRVMIKNKQHTVLNSLKIYVKSVLEAVSTGDVSTIEYYDYEL